jgi:hypothetical protein
MIKTAIFVEGQTELIFVREFLLKISDYQDISIKCYTLFNDSELIETEYNVPCENATKHFQLLNVGNDNRVLTAILKREKYLFSAGYHKIIGLRDMYGAQYRQAVKTHTINPEMNQKFIHGAREQLTNKNTHFVYSIMEIEAWLLGLQQAFQRMDARLTPQYIQEQLNYNIEEIDPETFFFHPANDVSNLYRLAGRGNYDKSKGDVHAIVSYIEKDDYLDLKNSDRCHSFNEFCTILNI